MPVHVEALPDGLDTALGSGAVKLSGGQRQRIVIARTLLQDPIILILDGATASVDGDTEEEIIGAIDKKNVGGGASPQHRRVRIIRDYGLLSRREAPHFHRPAEAPK